MIHTDGVQTIANAERGSQTILDVQRERDRLADELFEVEVELAVERMQYRRLAERNGELAAKLSYIRGLIEVLQV